MVGRALEVRTRRPRFNRTGLKTITETTVRDDNDDELSLVWFNQNFVGKVITPGARIAVAGLVKQKRYGDLQMVSPHFELLDATGEEGPKAVGGLMPKYHLVKGLSSKKISLWVAAAMPAADEL